jgi:hypothetical protein
VLDIAVWAFWACCHEACPGIRRVFSAAPHPAAQSRQACSHFLTSLHTKATILVLYLLFYAILDAPMESATGASSSAGSSPGMASL